MSDTRRDAAGRLDQPREAGAQVLRLPWPSFDSDRFGVFAERFARFMGTARFLVWMTVFVIIWITVNLVGIFGLDFDPYPFILLNLFFSTQASYAAPLILLAQNRQDDRDRVTLEQDRARDERNLADTEYLTREVASLRISLREMATRDFLRSELRDLVEELAQQQREECPHCGAGAEDAKSSGGKKGKGKKSAGAAPKGSRTSGPDRMADEARARLAGIRRAEAAAAATPRSPGAPEGHQDDR